jgi:hypothetical protein
VTIIAHIVEKFVMEIEEPEEGHDEWFLDWVLRSPKNAGRHLTAGWLGLNRLKEVYRGDEIQTCDEWFGGMGAQALMADRLFNLRNHWVGEFSRDAVAHLELALSGLSGIEVFWRDAYAKGSPAPAVDLEIVDFGDLTAWKTREGELHRILLDDIFATEPKAVLLTDIACRYLHLHRERYETLLGEGTCGSYENYLNAFQKRIQRLYGYVPAVTHYDRWSAVMALVPQGAAPWGELVPTPASPVGLEIL